MRSLVELAFLDEITRGFGQEQQASSEDERPEHLNSNRDAVRARVIAVLGGVVNARSQHKTDGNAELVSADQSSSHFPGANLGHVKNDGSGHKSHTEASNQTAWYEEANARRGGLENNTNDEDNTSGNDRSTTAKPIGKISGNQSSKEGAAGEDRNDEGCMGG